MTTKDQGSRGAAGTSADRTGTVSAVSPATFETLRLKKQSTNKRD